MLEPERCGDVFEDGTVNHLGTCVVLFLKRDDVVLLSDSYGVESRRFRLVFERPLGTRRRHGFHIVLDQRCGRLRLEFRGLDFGVLFLEPFVIIDGIVGGERLIHYSVGHIDSFTGDMYGEERHLD